MTKEEIKEYFPKLKYVLYAAGSVQGFAKDFLESGVAVSSAWRANAVPVADYAYSQIILSLKGFFNAANVPKEGHGMDTTFYGNKGIYKAKVGICGVGAIGSLVCEKLKASECEVLAFDKFLSEEQAYKLNVRLCTLEEIFKECNVISNHLADKAELNDIYNYDLFKTMKPYATFINTGRGAQVVEDDLVKAMKEDPTRRALLDVTYPEPVHADSPMIDCQNIIITPHIAGSIGCDCTRMADWMIDEYLRVSYNQPQKHGVSLEMLKTMA